MKTERYVDPADQRYFEDFIPGTVYEVGTIIVEESEIIAFSERFDPQDIHVNPDVAKKSIFGGLIASGWHTASLTMRLYHDHYLSHSAILGAFGVDELRWLIPVRPGDTLSLRITVTEARRSRFVYLDLFRKYARYYF